MPQKWGTGKLGIYWKREKEATMMVAAGDLHKITRRPLLFCSRCRREGLSCPLTQNAEKYRLHISIIKLFCNSHWSILTLHSIHSTSDPTLYCSYEHWPCSLSYWLQEDRCLFSDYRLRENEENLEYEWHIWTPWGALWALEKHSCWHLCALHWWIDLQYT